MNKKTRLSRGINNKITPAVVFGLRKKMKKNTLKSLLKKIPFLIYLIRTIRKLVHKICKFIITHQVNFKSFVIVRIDGGLGSQMYQYALGLAILKNCTLPVKYENTWFSNAGKDLLGKHNRNFDLLKIFNKITDLPLATKKEIKQYEQYFSYSSKDYYYYDENVLFSNKPRYLNSYYQHIDYIKSIKKELQKLFVFNENFDETIIKLKNQIVQCNNSVAIHIRRGDYVNTMYDIITPNYFYNAIETMYSKLNSPTFFVFSNDMHYSREILKNRKETILFVDQNTNDYGYADLYLMLQCTHFIISNSSFSWWAAFLSQTQEKIVIAPNKWIADTKDLYSNCNHTAMIDSDWITLEC